MRYGEATPLGEIQMYRLAGAQYKLAKAHQKTDKYKTKIADLEYKNSKIDKKLKKLDIKQSVNEVNARRKEAKDNVKRAIENQDPNNSYQFTKDDQNATLRAIDQMYDEEIRAIKKAKK